MTLDYFKDKLFDLLNEDGDELDIADIRVNDSENSLYVLTGDGSGFEVACRELQDKESNGAKETDGI